MRRALCFLALCVVACGDDEETPVTFDCTCTAVCDGNTTTLSGEECSRESEIQSAVDRAVNECVAALLAPPDPCQSAECSCSCVPRDPEEQCEE